MGEAKRRKKSDHFYGKDNLEVQLDSNLALSSSLIEASQLLSTEYQTIEKGRVLYRGETYSVLFLPYRETALGETKLYSHIVFDPDKVPKNLNQRLTDKISRLATLEIIDKYTKLSEEGKIKL